MKTERDILEEETEEHILNDINWDAHNNEVIKTANKSITARYDVEQFTTDSFFHGWQKAKEYYKTKLVEKK